MKVHYISGVAALFVVAVHILMRLVVPVRFKSGV